MWDTGHSNCQVVLWTQLDVVQLASRQVVMWMQIFMDHKVLVASGHSGSGGAVSG